MFTPESVIVPVPTFVRAVVPVPFEMMPEKVSFRLRLPAWIVCVTTPVSAKSAPDPLSEPKLTVPAVAKLIVTVLLNTHVALALPAVAVRKRILLVPTEETVAVPVYPLLSIPKRYRGKIFV